MRWKPLGRTWIRNRRMNSSAVSVVSVQPAPFWRRGVQEWGHRGIFPKEHYKRKAARYQNVAPTVWATVQPQTEKSRDFCCSTRLSNGLGWQQDQATALSVLFREDSTMTPISSSCKPKTPRPLLPL